MFLGSLLVVTNNLTLQYFALLSHMLEVYPEMVAQLNNDASTQVLGTLDFGLRHQVSGF